MRNGSAPTAAAQERMAFSVIERRILAPAEQIFAALIDPTRRARTVTALIFGFVAVWTLFGVISLGSEDVHPDIVQSLQWARDQEVQYHPPLLAWTVKLWFALFPVADWAAYLLAAANVGVTLAICWVLFSDWLDDQKRVVALAMLTLIPLYTFQAGKFNANTVMMPYWAATTLFFLRSFRTGDRLAAALAGIAAGGAMLGKYWSLFLLAGLALAALLDPRRLAYLRSSAPWITIAAGAAVVAPHAIDIWQEPLRPAQLGISTGLGAAIVQSLAYLLACAGYAAIPLLLLALLRPSREAIRDIFLPSSPDRRLVATSFLVPLVLPAAVNVVAPYRLTSLWTIPNWSLLPIVLLGSPKLHVDRTAAVRILALALAVPFGALAAAPAIALIAHLTGGTDGNARASVVARAVQETWRGATDRPLRWVGSKFWADGVIFYLPDTVQPLGLDHPQAVQRLTRDGGAVVCPAADAGCVARLNDLARDVEGKRTEVELARRYFGIDGRRERYLIFTAPPR
jgi:4-amino-4-deoxy-L-arabinose transferase-like glycosyltransferase